MNSQLLKFIIAVLDDDNGINANAYQCLKEFEDSLTNRSNELRDIFPAVRQNDGRYYLPENFSL